MRSMDANRKRNRRRHLREVGQRLSTYRQEEGLTRSGLATELCVSPSTIRRWEAGESAPDAAQILTLSMLLGVTAGHLLGDA